MSAIDVVVCPDFEGPLRRIFEARTLLFLGSWLEHEGASRRWPLHVVCTGDPPTSVRALAERCGASVQVREGFSGLGNRIMNRLRGLEIESRTGRILMVDCDCAVLRDLSPLLELGDCFAAVVAPRNPLPAHVWQEIFDVAGVKMPADRVEPWVLQAAGRLPLGELRRTEREPMPPYFQAAVYLVPARSSLRENWERIQRLLSQRYADQPRPYDRLWKKTQCSLTICVAILAEEGIPWRLGPPAMNVMHLNYAAGDISYDETLIFHAGTVFRNDREDEPLDPIEELDRFLESRVLEPYRESRLTGLGRRLRGRPPSRAEESARKIGHRLAELTERYVAPAF